MNQLKEINRIRHNKYMEEKWLPDFYKFFKKNLQILKLQKFIKNKHFINPINLEQPVINSIPGIYRFRTTLTFDNLLMPEATIKDMLEATTKDMLEATIKDMPEYDMLDDIDDQILNQIINESISDAQKEISNNDNNVDMDIDNNPFHIILDIRIYGPDPYQPIFIDDIQYYLSEQQIKKILTVWNTVNTHNTYDSKFKQNLEYIGEMVNDYKL